MVSRQLVMTTQYDLFILFEKKKRWHHHPLERYLCNAAFQLSYRGCTQQVVPTSQSDNPTMVSTRTVVRKHFRTYSHSSLYLYLRCIHETCKYIYM